MLVYAYQSLSERDTKQIEAENFENIHDLISSILIMGISKQIKGGLNRDYISNTDMLRSLKGKIEITDSIKRNTMMKKQMVCKYDLFSEDNLLNQILKSSMKLLIFHGNVKYENKKKLRKLLLYFDNVSDINPYVINWSAVSYHRNNKSYRTLINICWYLIKGLLFTTNDGKYKIAQYLDDQTMHRLYEKFVLGYFRMEYPQLNASSSYIEWNISDNEDSFHLPRMQSDVTLTYGEKILIIDTKYYGKTMQHNPMYDKKTYISNNLYQIYTYVKNKDRNNSKDVSGMILYAKTDEDITPDATYNMNGNSISLKTLDLSGEWRQIKYQLDLIAKGIIV